MRRIEAQFAMMNGKRVKHRLFQAGEWISSNEKGDMIYTEDGYSIYAGIFWGDRSSACFDEGWEVLD